MPTDFRSIDPGELGIALVHRIPPVELKCLGEKRRERGLPGWGESKAVAAPAFGQLFPQIAAYYNKGNLPQDRCCKEDRLNHIELDSTRPLP